MFHNNDLFLEPKTTQYGSHMVMTNVNKCTKTKYVSIDTQFCDDYGITTIANIQYTLPERINDVKSLDVVSMEIPMTIYNISTTIGNNSFEVTAIDASGLQFKGNSVIITIPDGNYTTTTLFAKINTLLSANGMTAHLNLQYVTMTTKPDKYFFYYNALGDNKGSLTTLRSMYTIDFTSNEKFEFKNSLGWLLGYRSPVYTIQYIYKTPQPSDGWYPVYLVANGGSGSLADNYQIDGQPLYLPEKLPYITGPKYLYLAIDEYTNGTKTSFVSQVNNTYINKNIIAKIVLDNSKYAFGTILPVGKVLGNLFCEKRKYNGSVDIQKLNIQILNEYGNPVDFNGIDFGITLSFEYE